MYVVDSGCTQTPTGGKDTVYWTYPQTTPKPRRADSGGPPIPWSLTDPVPLPTTGDRNVSRLVLEGSHDRVPGQRPEVGLVHGNVLLRRVATSITTVTRLYDMMVRYTPTVLFPVHLITLDYSGLVYYNRHCLTHTSKSPFS